MADRNFTGQVTETYKQQQAAVSARQRVAAQQMQAQAQQQPADPTWYETAAGTVLGWLDNAWTDDVSAAPVIGPVLKAAGPIYGGAVEGISTGLSTAALAANPMYWQNRAPGSDILMDASETQPGRATVALGSGLTKAATDLVGGQGSIGGSVVNAGMRAINPFNGVLGTNTIYDKNPDFNIANQTQRDNLFENDTALKIQSGLVDGFYSFYLDPLVIGGKAVKIARFGTTAMGLGKDTNRVVRFLSKGTSGFTNRTVMDQRGINLNVVKALETEADEALAGGTTPIGIVGENIARQGFDELVDYGPFQGSSRDLLAAAGSAITTKEDGIIFAAAMAGSTKYQALLAQQATGVYAGLQRAARNLYEEKLLNTPIGAQQPAILPEFLEKDFSIKMLQDDLAKQSPEFRAFLEEDANRAAGLLRASDLLAAEGEGAALIERIGGTSVTGMRIAAAWRAGRNARTYAGERNFKPRFSTGPAVYEQVFEGASSVVPKFHVWDWVRGSQASGYIAIGGLNVGKGSDELRAALSDSRTIRKDKAFVAEMIAIYGKAATTTERMDAVKTIEERVMKRLAEEASRRAGREVKEADVKAVYKIIDKRRDEVVSNFRDRAYGVDPFDGTPIKASAALRSQLETDLPMLNLRMLEKTIKILTKPHYLDALRDGDGLPGLAGKGLTSESVKNMVDEIQSLWKAGVLLRLGYTIRNTGEGWLRTAAFLGSVPAAGDLPGGLKNSVYNNSRRIRSLRGLKGTIRAEDDAVKRANSLTADLADLRARRAGMASAQDPTVSVTNLDQEILAKESALQEVLDGLQKLAAKKADLKSRRGVGDDGAFGGALNSELSDLYRRLSGADQTTRNFLESAWARGQEDILSQSAWSLIKPGRPQYWNELSGAVRQLRQDSIGRRLLAGEDIGDVVNWLKSSEGKAYRRDMRVSKEAAEERVAKISGMINLYLPTREARALAASGVPDAAQLKTVLGAFEKMKDPPLPPSRGRYQSDLDFEKAQKRYEKKFAAWQAERDAAVKLSPVHGRQVAAQLGGPESIYVKVRQATIDRLFNLLGTYPESTLVRHPFYAEVWQRRFNQLEALARQQGTDLTPETLERINRASHRYAMRATNETLYTVERYSNLSAALRWVAPFFPAWENSAKVWTRLVVNDPSILARGSILWQMPEKIGLVVDENGDPVDISATDFLTGSQNKYVVLPAAVNSVVEKIAGGANLKVPLASLNVVTPGTTPYLPGFGPTVTYPVGKFLASKPDVQAFLRKYMGQTLYEQIAPFGVPQSSLMDAFAPSALRKGVTLMQGEGNEDYLRITGAMWQNAMTEWYLNGGNPEDKPNADEIMRRANQFLLFSTVASLTLPFATTRTSPYQIQVDDWNRLKADQTMTYAEKVDSFIRKWGDSYAPLLTSTSKTDVPGVDPTLADYEVLRDHSQLARDLSALDPKALGVLASSAPLGEFDEGVYKWLNENNVPGQDGVLRGPRSVDGMGEAIQMQAAWREYRAMKELRDSALQQLGVKSLQAKAAGGVKAKWDEFVNVQMVRKYGEQWIVNYRQYQDSTPAYLTAITTAMNDKKFMGQYGSSPLWRQISEYMSMRQMALDAIAAGADSASVREQFGNWANEQKFSSLEFSDFFDKFLDQDNLAEIGVENLG